MNNTNEFFYCYSTNLHDLLRSKGLRYICVGLNENTMRRFYQYRRTKEFEDILAEYTANNPNK
jgi:hypothetical protein